MDVENNEETKPQIITGGTDSRILVWNDVTAETEVKELEEQEDKLLKEEQLRILNYNKEYYEALKLALDLNRKSDFVSILKTYVSSNLNANYTLDLDPINIVIANRKAIEEVSDKDDKERIKTILKDQKLRVIIKNNRDKVLEIIRDHNIKTSNFFYVQVLLKLILITSNHESFGETKKNLGVKNKAFKAIKNKRSQIVDINHMENFQIIRSYSEKHLDRVNRELTKSCLLDYLLNKIKII